MVQLHRRFTDSQVKELIERYLRKEIETRYIQNILGIRRKRFFAIINAHRHCPHELSIHYKRSTKNRTMPQAVEENILREIQIEKSLIENPDTPLRHYNYSYVKNLLETKYIQKVSLSTIIDRAKKHDFYVKKRPKKILITGRLTNYGGEIIYHDSPYHLWSSPAKEKCYLITSLDDFSRFMLYVTLLKKEASWAHILFLQTVVLRHGALFLYYVDSPFNLSVCERQGLPAVDITYPH